MRIKKIIIEFSRKTFLHAGIAALLSLVLVVGTASSAGGFFDNFNDGTAGGWISAPPYSTNPEPSLGNWRVENGEVVQDLGGDHYKFLHGNQVLGNQSVQAKILAHDNGYAGLTLWHQDDDNWVDVYIYPAAGFFGVLEKQCAPSPCGRDATETTYPHLFPRDWQTLRLDANSAKGTIAVYLDSMYMFTHKVASNIQRAGLSGFNSGNSGGSFDDYSVKKGASSKK